MAKGLHRLACPACGSQHVQCLRRGGHNRAPWHDLFARYGFAPYQCSRCARRFYKQTLKQSKPESYIGKRTKLGNMADVW